MKEYLFVCGSGIKAEPASSRNARHLDVAGPRQNVKLRLADVSRPLLSNLPDLLVDLLELASYVYCADQRAGRGSDTLPGAGAAWRRHLRFVVPVRCPEVWSSADVRGSLEDVLGFLSDDHYQFEFVESQAPPEQKQLYFANLTAGDAFSPDDVVLFSGGIDSLAGTVDSLASGKRLLLVGHHSAPKVVNIQTELVRELRNRGYRRQLFHVTVNVTNLGAGPIEPTQRTRSFLFASLALVLARMVGRDGFTFYENGIVSLNLPLSGDVLGARATRTTHPRVVRGFEIFFSQLLQRQISIETPFLWLTKKEIVERLLSHHADLLPMSVSCVHPISWTKEIRHCGTCSQCIDRRFAVLAAGAEQHEDENGYRVDLLTGDRSHEDLDPAIAYVKFARTIANMESTRFQTEFPHVSAALHSVPGMRASEVLEHAWALHRRHAEGVTTVLSDATKQYSGDLVRGRLAAGSLLSLCFARDRVETVGPDTTSEMAAFIDRLAKPVCDFAVDEVGQRICFRGNLILNGSGYQLVRELVINHRNAKRRNEDVPYYWTSDLAQALDMEEPALRKLLGRIRQKVESQLIVDQGVVLPNGFIENMKSKGYRLSPELREVSLADLQA